MDNAQVKLEEPVAETVRFSEIVADKRLKADLLKVLRLIKQVQLARSGAMRRRVRRREYLYSPDSAVVARQTMAFTARDLLQAVDTIPAVHSVLWNKMLKNVNPLLEELNNFYRTECWGLPVQGDVPTVSRVGTSLIRNREEAGIMKGKLGNKLKTMAAASIDQDTDSDLSEADREAMAFMKEVEDKERSEAKSVNQLAIEDLEEKMKPCDDHKGEENEWDDESTCDGETLSWRKVLAAVRADYRMNDERPELFPHLTTFARVKQPSMPYPPAGLTEEERLNMLALPTAVNKVIGTYYQEALHSRREHTGMRPEDVKIKSILKSQGNYHMLRDVQERADDLEHIVAMATKLMSHPAEADKYVTEVIEPETVPLKEDGNDIVVDDDDVVSDASRAARSITRTSTRSSEGSISRLEKAPQSAGTPKDQEASLGDRKVRFEVGQSDSEEDDDADDSSSSESDYLDLVASPDIDLESLSKPTRKRVTFEDTVRTLQRLIYKPKRFPKMSRVHDKPPPRHLTHELLLHCAQEQGPSGEEALIVREEGFDLKTVKDIRIDYRNVQTIDNLWRLPLLTKLQLCNNVIEKVEGLDTLVHLEWLDLTFNNIKVIQGLDKCTRLTDLALSHNLISKVEGLDSLKNLQVVTFGHNCIEDIQEFLAFRKLKELRSLTVDNNPCGQDASSAAFCLAYIPQLLYLNYRHIDRDVRTSALGIHAAGLAQLEKYEKEEEGKKEVYKKTFDKMKELEQACVEGLEGDDFFNSLFAQDGNIDVVIEELEETRLIKDQVRKDIAAVFQDTVAKALTEKQECDKMKKCFMECVGGAISDSTRSGRWCRDEVDKVKEAVMNEEFADSGEMMKQLKALKERITEAERVLLTAEIRLSDQIEEVTKTFERHYKERVRVFTESLQASFAKCREILKNYTQDVTRVLTKLCEDLVAGAIDKTELPEMFAGALDALGTLVVRWHSDGKLSAIEKDNLLALVTTAHDNHILGVDKKEDALLGRARKELKDYVKKLHDDELARNVRRVKEIRRYIDTARTTVEEEIEMELEYDTAEPLQEL